MTDACDEVEKMEIAGVQCSVTFFVDRLCLNVLQRPKVTDCSRLSGSLVGWVGQALSQYVILNLVTALRSAWVGTLLAVRCFQWQHAAQSRGASCLTALLVAMSGRLGGVTGRVKMPTPPT